MQIIEPKVEYWEQKDPILHVAHCAQVCYQSKPKDKEASEKFYKGLISSGHVSMLRHESCYYIIAGSSADFKGQDSFLFDALFEGIYDKCPYINYTNHGNYWYVSTNANFLLDNKRLSFLLDKWKVTPEEFKKECPELMRYTMCLTTQISTSRELNRCSPNNIAEMSTRYIKFGGKVEPSIVRPWWVSKEIANTWNKSINGEGSLESLLTNSPEAHYLIGCSTAFYSYNRLIGLNLKPEDARGILPLDTMTKVIYTYSIKEWENILKLRYLGTTGKPHPNAKIMGELIYAELQKLGYKFNENNELVYVS